MLCPELGGIQEYSMASALQELTDCEGEEKATMLTVHLQSEASYKGARAVGVHRGGATPSRECIRVCARGCVMVGREDFSEKGAFKSSLNR